MKKMASRFIMSLLALLILTSAVFAADYLIPVGQVIGLELRQDCVTVAGFDDSFPGDCHAGLQIGDEILEIDRHAIHSAEEVRKALNSSRGSIDLTVLRKGKQKQLHLSPEITPQGPRLGIYLRQGITGIGTVTWFDPATSRFGTLGHGVNDASGHLLTMTQGRAYPAAVAGIQRGAVGRPGQLKGVLNTDALLGELTVNSGQGVFGIAPNIWSGEAIPVAVFSELRTGPATIRSTICEDGPRDYSVEILKIYPRNRSDGRNLLLRVTDPELLAATGGIVQGMSGSPIIQDGRLVGAVTHVLVNDPTTGYGIFIENMLEAAG